MQALVIDDSRAMRAILTRQLEAMKFDVAQAFDGRDAMDLLDGGYRPDVALVDWNMPRMDGLTLIKAVRAREELRDVALMMVTTESEQANIVRALAAGAHEYLIKPFTEEALNEKLSMLGLVGV